MCGIAGFKVVKGGEKPDETVLRRMLARIKSRGPDHTGVYVDERAAIGNTRLKIIDIEGGDQPIFNEDGTVAVVYNGEIYNFPELRESLIKSGHRFKTKSDTEVLVHLYEDMGTDFIPLLNGMFAFAIYDIANDRMIIGRDRFGVKPLFYSDENGRVAFASELGALLELPGFEREVDYQALSVFLCQMYIPQPWTVFRNARRLRAGHYLEVTPEGVAERRYHDFDFSSKQNMDSRHAENEIIRLLDASVERQLISDVPVGVFLSSGLDSCSVMSMASKHYADRLRSFTLTFDDGLYDESSEAARWAEHFGSPHERALMSEGDFINAIEGRLTRNVEPMGPWINVGHEFLAAAASGKGYKVALSGAGGDEFFCGYPTLNAAWAARFYRLIPPFMRDTLIKKPVGALPAGSGALPLTFMLKSFVNAVEKDPVRTFFNFKAVIHPTRFEDFLTPEALGCMKDANPYAAFEQYSEVIGNLPLMEGLQYIDIKAFMEGCVLSLGDNATMARSLEERFPFLDNDLAAFACSIPLDVKFRAAKVKPLLKEAMRSYLSNSGGEALVRRYKKRGFELPANAWLKSGAVREYVSARLSEEALSKAGFFRPEAVRAALEDHFSGRRNNERLAQVVLGVTHFLENF